MAPGHVSDAVRSQRTTRAVVASVWTGVWATVSLFVAMWAVWAPPDAVPDEVVPPEAFVPEQVEIGPEVVVKQQHRPPPPEPADAIVYLPDLRSHTFAEWSMRCPGMELGDMYGGTVIPEGERVVRVPLVPPGKRCLLALHSTAGASEVDVRAGQTIRCSWPAKQIVCE